MSEDLPNEIEAINAIYGDGTLAATDEAGIYVLHLPAREESLRIQFPACYPAAAAPLVLGTHSLGEHAKRGSAAHVVAAFRDAVARQFRAGDICLFDVLEDVGSVLAPVSAAASVDGEGTADSQPQVDDPEEAPPWIVSDVVTEQKSVFVARCARVTSPEQARLYVQQLLATDKRVARATHNITAHRIRGASGSGAAFQDCDDDGETAAGGRLLHLMQLMNLWDVMVVVTRWYGGQKLGPARFGIINAAARDAFVKAGLVHDENSARKKGKR